MAQLLVTQRSSRLSAADKEAPKKVAPAKDKADAKEAPKSKSARLPNYYGDLGLNDEQKEKVRTIVAGYDAKIADLEKQLAALKQKRDSETEAVLTAAQKTQLAQVRAQKKASSTENKAKVAKTKGKRSKDDDSTKTETKKSAN